MEKKNRILVIASICSMIVCLLVVLVFYKIEKDGIDSLYITKLVRKYTYQGDGKNDEKTSNVVVVHDGNERVLTTGLFDKYIFVGDSRYRGMQFLAQDEDVFIAESGRGYSFLTEQMNNIKNSATENSAVIIGLGVNDNVNKVDDYLNLLKEMADSMECQIYYMLINPVDEEKESYHGYNVTNENIDYFNKRMVEELDERIGVIDTNSYLKDVGFNTQDGIHYDNDTYTLIYEYIKTIITY